VFFLITGASGAGKSTVRRMVEPLFKDRLVTGEIATLGVTPEWSVRWRAQMVELLVQRAIEARRSGKHFLLCGDPVPPGELLAVPSADQLDDIAVCLLDVSEEEQSRRLLARGDDPALLPRHNAFAAWMRRHVVDPYHLPEVITNDSWDEMRWDRWLGKHRVRVPWSAYVIDTTSLEPNEVADEVAAWIRKHLEALS
jgi:energy-coupling factor transporter ATP-binding protein EcfA2